MVKLLFCWMLLGICPVPERPADRAPHPLYISIAEIEHNPGSQLLEITCRIFTDDFESTLSRAFNTRVDLFNDAHKNANNLISTYIGQHLRITADGKPLTLKYVGYERQRDACWCYFEAAGVAAPKKVDVVNTLLHDFTDKQINMMHVTVGGSRKSYKLDYPAKEKSFEF